MGDESNNQVKCWGELLDARMPDGQPCPSVMLEHDLIRFLRLEELGVKHPVNTLRYYRERHKLRATRIGGRNCYTVQAALQFLEEMTEKKYGAA